MATKSEEIEKLLNLSGADRMKINFLLEEYLAEFANISDNSGESDGGDLDNGSPSSDESSDESSENDLDQNMDDIGDFGNAMTRLTARGDIPTFNIKKHRISGRPTQICSMLILLVFISEFFEQSD